MSNSVAALPTGTGVTVIAEHRHRRDDEPQGSPDGESPTDHSASDQSSGSESHREPPPPPAGTPPVPAETLFAATLLASTLPRRLPSSGELRLRTGRGWAPPDSLLRLKDKLI